MFKKNEKAGVQDANPKTLEPAQSAPASNADEKPEVTAAGETATVAPLPRYRCHKIVQAAKIQSVDPAPQGALLCFEAPGLVPRLVDAAYVEKHNPQVGGYYVHYEDGYESWSPAGAFEAGYSAMKQRTLADACNEFLGKLDFVGRGGRKRKVPGDLMAVRQDVENFLKIGHAILNEPVE